MVESRQHTREDAQVLEWVSFHAISCYYKLLRGFSLDDALEKIGDVDRESLDRALRLQIASCSLGGWDWYDWESNRKFCFFLYLCCARSPGFENQVTLLRTTLDPYSKLAEKFPREAATYLQCLNDCYDPTYSVDTEWVVTHLAYLGKQFIFGRRRRGETNKVNSAKLKFGAQVGGVLSAKTSYDLKFSRLLQQSLYSLSQLSWKGDVVHDLGWSGDNKRYLDIIPDSTFDGVIVKAVILLTIMECTLEFFTGCSSLLDSEGCKYLGRLLRHNEDTIRKSLAAVTQFRSSDLGVSEMVDVYSSTLSQMLKNKRSGFYGREEIKILSLTQDMFCSAVIDSLGE